MISAILNLIADSIHAVFDYFFTFKYYPAAIENKKNETTWVEESRKSSTSDSQLSPYGGGPKIFAQLEFIFRLVFVKQYGSPFRICPDTEPESSENFKEMELSDLKRVKTLGEGGFSKVHLVRRRSNSRLYALKVMEKPLFAEKTIRKHVMAERDILLSCQNPYIVRLYRTFRDSERLYMLMELCNGNELWTLIHKRRWLSEATSRYYFAAVLEALDYLHKRWIAHRDVKPENVIVDMNQRPKLIDFGFAKKLEPEGKTYSFCGTPQYVAPEMIQHKGHDIAVDNWALGILLYEMLTGTPPFVAPKNEDIYNAALRGFNDKNVHWPKRLSPESVDLIQNLCRQEPSQRLGYGRIQEAREHKWFNGFEFRDLRPTAPMPQTCRECAAQETLDLYAESLSQFDSSWDSVF